MPIIIVQGDVFGPNYCTSYTTLKLWSTLNRTTFRVNKKINIWHQGKNTDAFI